MLYYSMNSIRPIYLFCILFIYKKYISKSYMCIILLIYTQYIVMYKYIHIYSMMI